MVAPPGIHPDIGRAAIDRRVGSPGRFAALAEVGVHRRAEVRVFLFVSLVR